MKPIVVSAACRPSVRGCVWRRCRACHDLVELPAGTKLCGDCATASPRRHRPVSPAWTRVQVLRAAAAARTRPGVKR